MVIPELNQPEDDDMYGDEASLTICPDTSFTEHVDEPEDDMYGDEFSPTIVPDTSFTEHMDQVSVLFCNQILFITDYYSDSTRWRSVDRKPGPEHASPASQYSQCNLDIDSPM